MHDSGAQDLVLLAGDGERARLLVRLLPAIDELPSHTVTSGGPPPEWESVPTPGRIVRGRVSPRVNPRGKCSGPARSPYGLSGTCGYPPRPTQPCSSRCSATS